MTDDQEPADEPITIECDTHGKRTTAVLCGHLIRPTDTVLGFVENSSDPDDQQAWCDDCERVFLREDGKTGAFLAFNEACVVCDRCYARAKALHSNQSSGAN